MQGAELWSKFISRLEMSEAFMMVNKKKKKKVGANNQLYIIYRVGCSRFPRKHGQRFESFP